MNAGTHKGIKNGDITYVSPDEFNVFPGKFTPVVDTALYEELEELRAALSAAQARIAELEGNSGNPEPEAKKPAKRTTKRTTRKAASE